MSNVLAKYLQGLQNAMYLNFHLMTNSLECNKIVNIKKKIVEHPL